MRACLGVGGPCVESFAHVRRVFGWVFGMEIVLFLGCIWGAFFVFFIGICGFLLVFLMNMLKFV